MANFQRILGMASKALDKKTSGSDSGKTDWREMVRTAADKVTGDNRAPANPANTPRSHDPLSSAEAEDRSSVARYDYLIRTAPPEQLEKVHADAFARLTPAQRDHLDERLRTELPTSEQPASASPADLARSATRGETHAPGFLKKVFSGPGGAGVAGAGAGAIAGAGIGAAGGLLAAVAGGAVLSNVAAPLLEQAAGMSVDFESLTGGLGGVTEGAGDYAAGIGEQVSDLGSGFEIPGLSALGGLFGRDS